MHLMVTRRRAAQALGISEDNHLPTHDLLAAFLWREKFVVGEASIWRPYLNTLPKSYSVPYYSAKAELEALPEYVRGHCEDQIRAVNESFQLVRKLSACPAITSSSYSWAYFTVNTRAVYLREHTSDSAKDSLALAPLLDMFNHSCSAEMDAGPNSTTAEVGGDCYQIVTRKGYSRYRQVFINYGPHDNLRLCLEYGFAMPNNSMDSVPIRLSDFRRVGIGHEDNVATARKSGLADKMTLSKSGPSWNFKAVAYILQMAPNRLPDWREVFEVDLDSDAAVAAWIEKVLQDREEGVSSAQKKLRGMDSLSESANVLLDLIEMHLTLITSALINRS